MVRRAPGLVFCRTEEPREKKGELDLTPLASVSLFTENSPLFPLDVDLARCVVDSGQGVVR